MGEGGEDLGKEIGFKGEARLSIGEGEGERNGWREPVTRRFYIKCNFTNLSASTS